MDRPSLLTACSQCKHSNRYGVCSNPGAFISIILWLFNNQVALINQQLIWCPVVLHRCTHMLHSLVEPPPPGRVVPGHKGHTLSDEEQCIEQEEHHPLSSVVGLYSYFLWIDIFERGRHRLVFVGSCVYLIAVVCICWFNPSSPLWSSWVGHKLALSHFQF